MWSLRSLIPSPWASTKQGPIQSQAPQLLAAPSGPPSPHNPLVAHNTPRFTSIAGSLRSSPLASGAPGR